MGPAMGVKHLGWTHAPDLASRLGDEHWPLLDYLLAPPQVTAQGATAPTPISHATLKRGTSARNSPERRAALEALIQAAFGP